MPKRKRKNDGREYGDNSGDESPQTYKLDKSAKEKLATFIKRIEKLTEEKKETAAEITEAFKELKTLGYDTKAVRRVIRDRAEKEKMGEENYDTLIAVVDLYNSVF